MVPQILTRPLCVFQGVLTQTDGVISDVSTCRNSYKKPEALSVQKTGKRREMLEKELYEKIRYEGEFCVFLKVLI